MRARESEGDRPPCARAWAASLPRSSPPTAPSRCIAAGSLQLLEIGAKLARSEVVRTPERAEHALADGGVARCRFERARKHAPPLAARHGRKAAPVEPAVDPHVPELVQGFAVGLGMSGEVDARFVVVLEMAELMEAGLRKASRRELASHQGRRARAARPGARPQPAPLRGDEVAERE